MQILRLHAIRDQCSLPASLIFGLVDQKSSLNDITVSALILLYPLQNQINRLQEQNVEPFQSINKDEEMMRG